MKEYKLISAPNLAAFNALISTIGEDYWTPHNNIVISTNGTIFQVWERSLNHPV